MKKKGVYYFIGDNPAGTAIYKTDGTKNGLKKITTDIDRNIYSVTKFDITDNGKPFYVLSNHFTSNYELWTSDGTSPGTSLLSALVSFNPTMITNGNYAFFAAGDFEHGYELWKSNGTIAGTQIVKDINPGPDGSYPYSFISYNGSIYFGAYDNSYIYTCWKSDGTEIGTFKIANVQLPFTFKNDGLNSYVCISNKTLYLSVFSNETFQASLWKTNGTVSTTNQVSTELFYPYSLADVEGTLFFNAYNSFFEGGLWGLKPNAANPEFIKPGVFNQFPASSCGKLYFVSNDMLWSSDGTSSGTISVSDPFLSGLNSFTGLTGSNNKLFFSANSYQTGFELFVGNTCSSSTEVHSAQRSSSNLAQVEENPVNFEIYPNPATEIISVIFNRKNISNEKIIVTDITGRLLFDKSVTVKKGNNIISVSVNSLPTGTYFIKLSGKKGQVKQFVKLN